MLEFEARHAPHLLRVFSDMLHHALRYSHLDLGWRWWRFEDLATRADNAGVPAGRALWYRTCRCRCSISHASA